MSLLSPKAAPVVSGLIRLAADIVDDKITNPLDVARSLMGIGLETVTVEQLYTSLTEAARLRAERDVDALERAKFPAG